MNRSAANWIGSTIQCRHCCERVTHVEDDFLCTPCHQLRCLFPDGQRHRSRRRYDFVTRQMIVTIPALYATEDVDAEQKTLYAHYFVGGADWYVVELDSTTGLAFGHADLGLGFPEWGYFDLIEMEAIVAHNGLVIVDRDLDFKSTSARELGIA